MEVSVWINGYRFVPANGGFINIQLPKRRWPPSRKFFETTLCLSRYFPIFYDKEEVPAPVEMYNDKMLSKGE